jgi:hypothetical protein
VKNGRFAGGRGLRRTVSRGKPIDPFIPNLQLHDDLIRGQADVQPTLDQRDCPRAADSQKQSDLRLTALRQHPDSSEQNENADREPSPIADLGFRTRSGTSVAG